MSLQILQPGLFSSLQDEGRYSGMMHGVPISGAMDMNLFQFINSILLNPKGTPCIEFYHQGLSVGFQKPAFICVGALGLRAELNGKRILPFKILKIKPNDVLSIKEMTEGNWGYLAIKDGFDSYSHFESQSFFEPLTKKRFEANDEIHYNAFEGEAGGETPSFDSGDYKSDCLEVYPGPEFSKLSRTLSYQLFNAEFSLSSSLDRMAYQIQETLENELDEIMTGPVLPGTIQYTSGGKLIVLMRDAQVTGGYPRILQLSEKAINILVQKRTKSKLRFKLTEINSETI